MLPYIFSSNSFHFLEKHPNIILPQGILDYRDDRVQKKFPDNRGYILYYSAQNDQKFSVIVRNRGICMNYNVII